MRSRNSGGSYGDRISMKGVLPQWKMCGIVQMVHSNNSTKYPADFVRFQIRPKGRENDESAFGVTFAVTVPDALGIQLERGDKVYIEGTITSWKNDNGFRLELIATKVQEWDGFFKEERARLAAGDQSAAQPAQQKSAKRRLGESVEAEQLERRGSMIYPAGTAPKEKPAAEDEETVDFGEYEGEIIGASEPLPF